MSPLTKSWDYPGTQVRGTRVSHTGFSIRPQREILALLWPKLWHSHVHKRCRIRSNCRVTRKPDDVFSCKKSSVNYPLQQLCHQVYGLSINPKFQSLKVKDYLLEMYIFDSAKLFQLRDSKKKQQLTYFQEEDFDLVLISKNREDSTVITFTVKYLYRCFIRARARSYIQVALTFLGSSLKCCIYGLLHNS